MATATLEMDVQFSGTADQRAMLAVTYPDVTVEITHVTPDLAKLMLGRNTKNRPLNQRHAERFRDAILAGEWWMNGETIIFAADGTLLNGQHRLWAIIAAGVGIDVLVVRGIDAEAFKTLDGVRARRAGEVLQMSGESSGNQVAACVQALLCFVDSGGKVSSGSTNGGRKATPSTCYRVLESHPGIRRSVFEMRRNVAFRSQHASMLHYLFSKVSTKAAEDFANVLADGHSDIGRPFVIFRETLLKTPIRSDLRRVYCAKAIKAFNAEMSGERPKMFKFLATEDFPSIGGLDYEKIAESIG
ncbi:MAG: hypothetical protein WCG15_00025 [Actinomycetes bacterium]